MSDTMAAQPIRSGVGWSALAALLFGSTAPLVKHASVGAGPLASGALLYLGAAIAAAAGLVLNRNRAEAPIRGRQVPALLATALVGGLVAPALLVLGLQRANAASGSLLLALEAPLTVLLARLVYGEHIGRRAAGAAVLVFAGALLVAGPGQAGLALGGGLLVGAATLAWAVDNIVSRGLADRDPLMVVLGKGGIGGAAAALAALARGEPWPAPVGTALLLVAGGLGFGVSLQLYLRAQRLMGAARTASVFSLAPFLGTATAFALGAPWPGWSLAAAAAVMGAGVWLHASERHEHLHEHGEIEHEHLHTHDDLHHDHHHDPMPAGPHSHVHRHGRVVHSHPHSEDSHHRHSH
jgi:drug/metabolite transporter (DMT)-like permease